MRLKKNILSSRYKNDGDISVKISLDSCNVLRGLQRAISEDVLNQKCHDVCPLCHELEACLIAAKDRLGIPSNIVICKKCGFIFNDSYFDESASRIFYKQYWSRIQWNNDPEGNFQKRTHPNAFSWKRYKFIHQQLKQKMDDVQIVFEIGCGDGCNLFPFYKEGKNTYGCDFDESFLSVGCNHGMNLLKGSSDVLQGLDKKADLIILSHVMEHFIDLDKEILKIKNLLTDNGYLYVEVPGILNWVRPHKDFITEDGYCSSDDFLAYLQAAHNYYFHLNSLVPFLERNGFKLMYGDEWVRAIFCKNAKKGIQENNFPNDYEKIFQHLCATEESYRSLARLPNRIKNHLKIWLNK